jgi:gas vesicle protein
MGETVEAIGYKTDVKARAKDSVTEKTDAVKDKVSSVMGRASDSTPSGEDVKQGVGQAVSTAQENPLGLAIGAVAVGFVAGMLIPSTSVEDEKIGPMADQLKQQAKETGQEAIEHGKQVAQDVAQSAQETVKESGQQHAQELASSASPSQG